MEPQPITEIELVRMRLLELKEQLLAAAPSMPTLLRDIRKQLQNSPECVTALTEEEINIIVSSAEKLATIQLAQTVTKSATSKATKNALRNISVDDL
jgi:hypothetical protein